MSIKKRLAVLAGAAALCLGAAAPASAQSNIGAQQGLVNVAIADVANNNQVVVQVPIGVAANVCGVPVAAIADQVNAPVACTAENSQSAPISLKRGGGGGGNGNAGVQKGLVNVAVVDALNDNQVVVQLPIGVAANVCGVDVALIAEQQNAPTVCDATTTADAPIRLF